MKKFSVIGIALFLIIIAGSVSAYTADGLCNSLTPAPATDITCTINTARTSTAVGCAATSSCRMTQTQMNGFWTWLAINRPGTTKVTWLIQNAEVYTSGDIILQSGTSILWDISLIRTSAVTSLRSDAGKTITFTSDVSNVVVDGAGATAGAYIQNGSSTGSVTMNGIKGNLEIKKNGLVDNANAIIISGKLLMDNHANMAFTQPTSSLQINGVAGEDSMTMINSEFDFDADHPGTIIVSNGNINISGVNPTYAIHYPKSIEANNGNITVQGTGRSESIWQLKQGRIYASGNITITDAQIDGYDPGGPPVGGMPSGITEFKAGGNITIKSNTANSNPILRTVQGPIIAGGKIIFEGQNANDMLLGDYSITGIFANELEIKNAKLEGITYNVTATTFLDPTKYGPIEVTGLMKLENADLAGDWLPSLGQAIRWVKAGALEMHSQSKLHLRGDITVQDYAEITDSAIEIHDLEAIDDLPNSPRKIEIVNPNLQPKPAFYLKGTNQAADGQYGITMHQGTSTLEILNGGDASHGAVFEDTKIKANNIVTINSCAFGVTGSLNITSAPGSTLKTQNSADLGRITTPNNFTWVEKTGCIAGDCEISSLDPANFSASDTFPMTVNLVVTANGFGTNPELHIDSCGSKGTAVKPNCKIDILGECACKYDALPGTTQTITGRIGSTDCTPKQFVCNDCTVIPPQPILPILDVFVSDIQLSTEKALFVGGAQTVTVTVGNTTSSNATGDIEISIVGPNSANSGNCSSNQTFSNIADTTFACTFGPSGTLIPFDKVGVYKVDAVISNITAGSDPITYNDSIEAFFFVAAEQQKSVPETGLLLLPILALVVLYITRHSSRQ